MTQQGAGLEGKVALVTGAARGIGAAVADALAAEGARVAIGDVDATGAKEGADHLTQEYGVAALGIEMDVTSRDSITAAIARVSDELGPLGVLVNNAGVDVIKPFVDSTEDEWDRIIAVNLKGLFRCCQAVLPGMLDRSNGVIVNFASDAARVGSSGEAVYSATKGGVISFTKTLAREVARRGVRVNCVSPGPTDTALLAQVADHNPKLREAITRGIPLRRIGEPADIAPAVVFLAGEGARYITGQTISVSGGLTMS